jgi:hypothetical protein
MPLRRVHHPAFFCLPNSLQAAEGGSGAILSKKINGLT